MNIELIRVDETAEDPWFSHMRAMATTIANTQVRIDTGMITLAQARSQIGLPPLTFPVKSCNYSVANQSPSRGATPKYVIYNEVTGKSEPLPGLFKCLWLDFKDVVRDIWGGIRGVFE